jgi:hypothetical protein
MAADESDVLLELLHSRQQRRKILTSFGHLLSSLGHVILGLGRNILSLHRLFLSTTWTTRSSSASALFLDNYCWRPQPKPIDEEASPTHRSRDE